MLILGHFALGYFSAMTMKRFSPIRFNIILVFLFSILPDIDFFFTEYIRHRGPTHSVIVQLIAFLPFLLLFRRSLPYFAAILSHSLIGDFVNPPVQLLWPMSTKFYGIDRPFELVGSKLIIVELMLFIIMLLVILVSRKNASFQEILFNEI